MSQKFTVPLEIRRVYWEGKEVFMNRAFPLKAKILTGLFVTAISALPQAYTISAKPGAVNYIEGTVLVNGQPLSVSELKSVFLTANATLSTTDDGRAEILLTPGVFLRVGRNSQVRMIAPSLIDTQIEIQKGEAMLEVDELVKENHISVVDHGSSIVIEKDGLYRFTADENPSAAVIEGKAEVYFGEKKVALGKGCEAFLSDSLTTQKFNSSEEDDVFAWSNIRSQYNASLSYQASRSMASSNNSMFGSSPYGYGYGYGNGFSGYYTPGWYFSSGFNSWLWMPGEAAFFSPFGYGFYGPGLVEYAPIVVVPSYGSGTPVKVPVNPKRPPVVALAVRSPAALETARAQVARAISSNGGFRTASGTPAPSFTQIHGSSGFQPAARASAGNSSNSASSFSRGSSSSSGSFSSTSSSGSMSSGSHAGGSSSSGSHK
jgi:hypothetical protein